MRIEWHTSASGRFLLEFMIFIHELRIASSGHDALKAMPNEVLYKFKREFEIKIRTTEMLQLTCFFSLAVILSRLISWDEHFHHHLLFRLYFGIRRM